MPTEIVERRREGRVVGDPLDGRGWSVHRKGDHMNIQDAAMLIKNGKAKSIGRKGDSDTYYVVCEECREIP